MNGSAFSCFFPAKVEKAVNTGSTPYLIMDGMTSVPLLPLAILSVVFHARVDAVRIADAMPTVEEAGLILELPGHATQPSNHQKPFPGQFSCFIPTCSNIFQHIPTIFGVCWNSCAYQKYKGQTLDKMYTLSTQDSRAFWSTDI